MSFLPGEFYHVYNRGNNKQAIFREDDNYIYFLQKIKKEISTHADILAYCLMPNHYHILLYIKEDTDEKKSSVLSRKFGTLQGSYAQGMNKRYNTVCSLFQQKIKSKLLTKGAEQAVICFHYIHQNPLKAKLVDSMEHWKYSSFKEYLNQTFSGSVNSKTSYDLLGVAQNIDLFLKESMGVINFDEGY